MFRDQSVNYQSINRSIFYSDLGNLNYYKMTVH